ERIFGLQPALVWFSFGNDDGIFRQLTRFIMLLVSNGSALNVITLKSFVSIRYLVNQGQSIIFLLSGLLLSGQTQSIAHESYNNRQSYLWLHIHPFLTTSGGYLCLLKLYLQTNL